ncbi:MAG TPA: stage II sporulation protein M [Anaerolineae bacterium]|nr:stage II sporulation protein M [Anaerolineae bacterium]HPL28926.1 stage II sporulation protein M [Anaerolineae bacterium]
MKAIRRAWETVQEYRRAYLALNLAYYGLVILGMIYVSTNPSLQQSLLESVGAAFAEGPLTAVAGAYGGGQVLAAMGITFAVNLLLGTLVQITLPSLIVPFFGVLMGLYRAVLWGLLLSPASPQVAGPMIPHSLTLLLEGQGYIIAMLGVYIQGKAFLWPRSVGAEGHRQGYVAGLKRAAWLYLLVAVVLAIAAIYEALEVIYLAPLFVR